MECAREIFLKPGFLQFHVPGAYWATPTLFLLEQSSAAGRSAEGSGCQGGRGHLGPARPAGQASPNLSPGLSSPGAEGSQSEGGGGGGCRERASPAEGGRAGPGLSSTETHPSCPPPTPAPALSSRRQLAAQCRSAGPPGPLRLSPPRSSAPFSSFPQRPAGLERGALPTPQLRDALVERAVTAGREGRRPPPGAWSARGPGAAGAARGLGWLRSARGRPRGCWRAALASARSPAREGPGCAPSRAAASAGARGRGPAAQRAAASGAGAPGFSSPRRLLSHAAGRPRMLRGSPEPLPAGSRA